MRKIKKRKYLSYFGLYILPFAFCFILIASQEKWNTLEGTRYNINYTTTTPQARELLNFMDEYIFPNYKFMLNLPDWDSEEKFTIRLYNDKEEYLTVTGAPKNSGAYYDPNTKELVGFYDDGEKMQALFAHEGMHQFTDMAIPNFERMPIWYIEGMADCIGNCKVDGKKFYVCVRDGWTAQKSRLPPLVNMFKKGEYIKLKNLLYYTKDMFYKEGKMAYPEAWGFCHFLLNAPHKGMDSDRKIKGRYKQVIVDLHNLMANNKDIELEDAYKQTFVYEDKPIDIDKLEKEFKDYILHLNED